MANALCQLKSSPWKRSKRERLQSRSVAGDILDGYHPKGESEAALEALKGIFDSLQKPHWHMIGNHCLYNLPREVSLHL